MKEENGEPTCGKGLAANAWLPENLSQLIESLAEVLANHMTALDRSEENGKKEYDAYESLVSEYRQIAAKLDKTAKEMASYRDLPMAEHDMTVMAAPHALEVFENLVLRKRELRDMLQQTLAEDQTMLAQMRG